MNINWIDENNFFELFTNFLDNEEIKRNKYEKLWKIIKNYINEMWNGTNKEYFFNFILYI